MGDKVKAGQELGTVTAVLKKDKGINPTSMLHFELYSCEPFGVVWELLKAQPQNLIDPTDFLLKNLK